MTLVRGPSGVGKSAVVEVFTASLRARGTVVLEGRCHERVAVPYKGLHGVAAGLAAHLRHDPQAREAALADADVALLPTIFPALAELPELARAARGAPTIRDPQQLRTRVFDAFAALLGRLAESRPLAVVIDDVQWADRDGLRLLERIASGDAAGNPGVRLIAVTRDGELTADAAWLGAAALVEIAALPADDAEELARRLAGADADVAAIAREAGGHPLHIAELVRHWQHGDGADAAAPRLDDVIGRRAAELPGDHARILGLIALAGAPLAPAVIGAAAIVDAPALWPALRALRAANLVRSHGTSLDHAIEPYHDRVRDAVAGRLSGAARRDGHARLAAAIERQPGADERPELLAYHLEAAGDTTAAATWAERAGDRAFRALAFDRAAELYQHALVLGARERERQVALQTRIGDAFAGAGRGGPAAEAYLAAARQAPTDQALELRRLGAEQLLRSGRRDAGLEVLDGVLREVGLPALGRRRFPVAALLGQRALLAVQRLRGGASPRRDDQRRLDCCWSAVVGLSMVSPMRSSEYQARHLRLAIESNDLRRITLGLAFEAVGAAGQGAPARRAHRLLAEVERCAAQVDTPLTRGYVAMAHGLVAFLTGRWTAALDHCDRAQRIFRDQCVGVAWEIGMTGGVAMTSLKHIGRINELRRRIGPLLADADRRGDVSAATQLRTVLQPNLCLMDDRVEAACAELDRAAAGLPRDDITIQHWQHIQATALVELYVGDPIAALRLIERHRPAMRRAMLFRIHAVRAFASYLRAVTAVGAAARGGPHAARWRRIALRERRALTGAGQPAAGRALIGAMLAALAGDHDAAVRGYRVAAAGFDAVDTEQVADATRWRLGELLGGDEGKALIDAAAARMRAEGVVRPDRVVAMFVPATHC